jgi:chemotaxis protein CheZ
VNHVESAVSDDASDMEALFDSIVSKGIPESIVPPAETIAVETPKPVHDEPVSNMENLISRVGHLTRTLHDNLRALGYDKLIEKTAAAIPDTRDRLAYVITMTEQAAVRTMNATDIIRPIQDGFAEGASSLTSKWDSLFAGKLSIEEFKLLVAETRQHLREVPLQTSLVNAQLMEIMMAQDFQDLTGQVIKKTTDIIQMLEQDLLQLLLDNIPAGRRIEVSNSLVNGPVINTEGRNDVVTNQTQVDDLLESLGF